MRRTIMLSALTLATVYIGQADSITFTGTSNSNYTYEYSLQLSNHNRYLFTNDGFTIYDFFGPLSFTAPNASWQPTTLLNAPGTANDETLTDVMFTYLGAPITGPEDLHFTITSSSNISRFDDSLLAFHKKQGQSIVPETLPGTVTVAAAPPEAVSEPAAVVLMLTGLLMLVLKRVSATNALRNARQ